MEDLTCFICKKKLESNLDEQIVEQYKDKILYCEDCYQEIIENAYEHEDGEPW